MQGICAVPVERDAQGFWTHPAMLQANLETSAEMTYWLRSHGLECWVMFMRDEDPEAFLAGFDEDCTDARGWNPSSPPGEGWFIGSIYDNEDGPMCLWFRVATREVDA